MTSLEDMVRRAQSGERAAVEQLLASHRDCVFGVAMSFLKHRQWAEEVAQEAFVRIFTRLDQLKKPASFRSWCLTLTANLCRDRLRARRPATVPLESVPEPIQPAAEEGLGPPLLAALSRLSEPLRLALVLRDVEGLAYDEVAGLLRLPLGTVKSRIFEARRQLRKLLTGEGVKV